MTVRDIIQKLAREAFPQEDNAQALMRRFEADGKLSKLLPQDVPAEIQERVTEHYRQVIKHAIQVGQLNRHIQNFKNN